MELLFDLLRRLDLSADLLGPLIFAIPWLVRTIRKMREQQAAKDPASPSDDQQPAADKRPDLARRAGAEERKSAVAEARRTAAAMLRRSGATLTAPPRASRLRAVASEPSAPRLRRSLAGEALASRPEPIDRATESPASVPEAARPLAPIAAQPPPAAEPSPWNTAEYSWPDPDSSPQAATASRNRVSAGDRPRRRQRASFSLDRSALVDAVVLQAALSPRGTRPRKL